MKIGLRGFVIRLLTVEARLALLIHRPRVVAVTGNIGKTTTKDAIFAVVSGAEGVRKSQKSFNSDIGVPLAILGLNNPWSDPLKWLWTLVRGFVAACAPGFPKLLVLEVGADNPGDISSIAAWLAPDVAVYTGVPEIPVHIVYFSTREALVDEKRSLLEHMKPGGVAIVNGDFDVAEATRGVSAKIVTYGTNPSSDIAASDVRVRYDAQGVPMGMSAHIALSGRRTELQIEGALGTPVVAASLAALAVAQALSISIERALQKLSNWHPTPGRMRVLRGVRGSIIVDDSYNSSPAAALSALATLDQLPAKRKIAVLGDMRELGDKSARAHREAGAFAARVADLLVTVGEESKVLAQAAREAGMANENVREYGYDSSKQVGEDLAHEIGAGDVVLVKGSQNHIRLERCVYELLADRSGAENQLVRFDDAWRRKR